ncbi:hypothetical protein GCM10009767_06920 [Kocuria aegyptia]|uniref:Uncharacterized protein n=1 Tax=Kocuria aegyptia TaxID=330943 RepID=A0ABP4WCI2_9MICC
MDVLGVVALDRGTEADVHPGLGAHPDRVLAPIGPGPVLVVPVRFLGLPLLGSGVAACRWVLLAVVRIATVRCIFPCGVRIRRQGRYGVPSPAVPTLSTRP